MSGSISRDPWVATRLPPQRIQSMNPQAAFINIGERASPKSGVMVLRMG